MNTVFNRSARSAFEFLEKDYGFRLAEDRGNYVRFQSDRVTVVASYDQGRSFEIFLDIGLRILPDRFFNFEEVLRSRRVPQDERPLGYQAENAGAVRKLICQMATLLQRYGSDLLCARQDVWNEINAQRGDECVAYAHERDLGYARSDADAAWARKDYVSVVKALSRWQEFLSPSDLKRLEYAKKKQTG